MLKARFSTGPPPDGCGRGKIVGFHDLPQLVHILAGLMDHESVRVNGNPQLVHPPDTPDIQNIQGGNQLLSAGGEHIFHLGRNGIIRNPPDQAGLYQLLQLLAEHLLRNRQGFQGLIESDAAIGVDLMEDGHFPLPANAVQDVMIGVGGAVQLIATHDASPRLNLMAKGCTLRIPSYHTCPCPHKWGQGFALPNLPKF